MKKSHKKITRRLNLLQDILNSNCIKSSKYVSLILQHEDLWGDLLLTVDNRKETFLHLVLKSENVQNLLSFLIPDWFDRKSCFGRSYALVAKSRLYEQETKENFLEGLCELIDDKKNQIYQDVCMRIVRQYIYELDTQQQASSYTLELQLNINKILKMRNKECRDQILQILVVFWKPKDNEFRASVFSCEKSEESRTYFTLAFLLREKQIHKFQGNFENFISSAEKTYGDYYKILLKTHVRLLFTLARRQNLHQTCKFILQKFPFIDEDSTLMTTFYDAQILRIFNIFPFKNKKFNELVKISFRFSYHNFETLLTYS